MSDPNVLHGTSEIFTTPPLAESPITLEGMKSYCLTAEDLRLSLPVLSQSVGGGYCKYASFSWPSRSVFVGETVALKVEVPQSPRSIQWRFQGVDLPGETNQSLVLTNVQAGQAGVYSAAVLVMVANRPVTGTNSIELKLTPRPGFEGVQIDPMGVFNARFAGITNRTVVIEKSVDLAHWSPVQTQWVGYFWFCSCVPAGGFTNRSPAGLAEFYRLRVAP